MTYIKPKLDPTAPDSYLVKLSLLNGSQRELDCVASRFTDRFFEATLTTDTYYIAPISSIADIYFDNAYTRLLAKQSSPKKEVIVHE